MKSTSRQVAIMMILAVMIQGIMPHVSAYARPVAAPQAAEALSLPAGKVGQSYQYQLRTEGGLPPFTWKVVGGELPPGVSLDASGKLKGIPTLPRREAYSFVIEVSDASQPSQGFAQPFLLMIQAAPLRMVVAPQPLKIVAPGQTELPKFTEEIAKNESRQPEEPPANPASARPLSSSFVGVEAPATRAVPAPRGNAKPNNAKKEPKKGTQPPKDPTKDIQPPDDTKKDKATPPPDTPKKDKDSKPAESPKPLVDQAVVGDEEITGTTKAKAKVQIRVVKKDTNEPVSATAKADGHYTARLTSPLAKGDKLLIQVTPDGGKPEDEVLKSVDDKPAKPSLEPIKAGAELIRGKAHRKAKIALYRNLPEDSEKKDMPEKKPDPSAKPEDKPNQPAKPGDKPNQPGTPKKGTNLKGKTTVGGRANTSGAPSAQPSGAGTPGNQTDGGTPSGGGPNDSNNPPKAEPPKPERENIPVDEEGNFNIVLDPDKLAKKGDKFQVRQTVNGIESDLSEAIEATEEKTEPPPPADCKVPKIYELHVGDVVVNGYDADPKKDVQAFRNTTLGDAEGTIEASADGTFTIPLKAALTKDDLIRVKEKGESCGFTAATGVVSMLDTTQGRLIGLAPFGNVISQQAEKISQADPFGGVVVGYMGPQSAYVVCRKTLKDGGEAKRDHLKTELSDLQARLVAQTQKLTDPRLSEDQRKELEEKRKGTEYEVKAKESEILTMSNDPANWIVYSNKDITGKEIEYLGQYKEDCVQVAKGQRFNPTAFKKTIEGRYSDVTLKKIPNLNWRIQGLFETAPRAAEAPILDGPDKGKLRRFIASRKSFDLELHGWWECMPGIGKLCSNIFRWGPYAAVGGTVALAKNELFGEEVSLPDSLATGSGRVVLDTTKVSSSNDIDSHFEAGFMFNYYGDSVEDSNLYVQAIMAFGKYEGLAGLNPDPKTDHNTKNRFIGKLRIFPTGLNRSFFERSVAAPMFGADLNAGRGEDNVRIFVGVAFNITKIITATQKLVKVP